MLTVRVFSNVLSFFFFTDTPTPDIYTLSLHDALPISHPHILPLHDSGQVDGFLYYVMPFVEGEDRKSTRLNSSHQIISYAVFCLKKKKDLQAEPSRVPIARDRDQKRSLDARRELHD